MMKHGSVTPHQMQEIDRQAQAAYCIPPLLLMENAGRAVFEVVSKEMKPAQAVVCVCGKGNNAGDGFVAARHLLNQGFPVEIFLVCDPETLKGEALLNYQILKKMKASFYLLKKDRGLTFFKKRLQKAALLIDAIFGIGLKGEVKSPYSDVIHLMNQAARPVVAVDVPSGLDALTGEPLGICVKAKKTVTFALAKTGCLKRGAQKHIGALIVKDIGIPRELLLRRGGLSSV